jgi:hypothetical protein
MELTVGTAVSIDVGVVVRSATMPTVRSGRLIVLATCLYATGCGDNKADAATGATGSQQASEAGVCDLEVQNYVTSCSADSDCVMAFFGDFCQVNDTECLGTPGYINQQSSAQWDKDYAQTPYAQADGGGACDRPGYAHACCNQGQCEACSSDGPVIMTGIEDAAASH